jgi:hypothetical protein
MPLCEWTTLSEMQICDGSERVTLSDVPMAIPAPNGIGAFQPKVGAPSAPPWEPVQNIFNPAVQGSLGHKPGDQSRSGDSGHFR